MWLVQPVINAATAFTQNFLLEPQTHLQTSFMEVNGSFHVICISLSRR